MSTLIACEGQPTIASNPSNLWNILDHDNTQVSPTALNERVHKHTNVTNNLTSPLNFQPTAEEDVLDQDNSEKTSDSEETRSIADSFSSVTTNNDEVSIPTIEELLVARSHIQKADCTTDEDETARKVCHILQQYSPAPRNPTKQPLNRSLIEQSVRSCIHQKKPLHLILPAFPFKSPNTIDKVLGRLPDMGEEIALATLDGLCAQINEVYSGTTLSIISDGLVYNDILGVSDEDVWNYGSQLRSLAKSSCRHISFVRLSKLVSDECPEPTTLDEYLAKASWYREEIVNRHLPKDFDVNWEIKHQINSLLTYRGYLKFLKTDLKRDPARQGLGSNKVKRMNEAVAKRMITRGAAFALAIQKAFPTSIRLSIHESESQCKLPIALFSGGESYTTPWHCTSALEIDGSWKHAHNEVFAADANYELVHRNERPSYYRKRSDLYDWTSCTVTPIHPCGLLISPCEPHAELSMDVIDMKKARKLAELNSPIVFRGFKNTTNRDLFLQKAREMGPVMPWKFGEVLVVKDAGTESAGLNNVLSAEPMPMHFDGMFKTVKVKDDAGKERLVPQPPKNLVVMGNFTNVNSFQWFTVATPSPKDCGHTLIASSRLLFSHLPQEYKFETLEKMTWTVTTTAFNNSTISNLQLVIPHPELGTPCLRYHEPWPSTKTRFDPTHVSIERLEAKESTKVTDMINELLYDRRICYYHEWVEGDLVLSDNISMMHTRTGFIPGAPRELWRIHID